VPLVEKKAGTKKRHHLRTAGESQISFKYARGGEQGDFEPTTKEVSSEPGGRGNSKHDLAAIEGEKAGWRGKG